MIKNISEKVALNLKLDFKGQREFNRPSCASWPNVALKIHLLTCNVHKTILDSSFIIWWGIKTREIIKFLTFENILYTLYQGCVFFHFSNFHTETKSMFMESLFSWFEQQRLLFVYGLKREYQVKLHRPLTVFDWFLRLHQVLRPDNTVMKQLELNVLMRKREHGYKVTPACCNMSCLRGVTVLFCKRSCSVAW